MDPQSLGIQDFNKFEGAKGDRRPTLPFFEAQDGGILSSDYKYLYFVGIIDTLTLYG